MQHPMHQSLPRAPEKAGFAGTVPGGTAIPVDDRQLSDFSAEQIQAALDELMKEDPDLMDGLSEHLELPSEAHPQQTDDGGVDYAASIKALAEKFGKQEQEIAARQHARQHHTDREDAQAAMESSQGHCLNQASHPRMPSCWNTVAPKCLAISTRM